MPATPSGTLQPSASVKGVNIVPPGLTPPEVKAQNLPPAEAEDWSFRTELTVVGAVGLARLRVGKAVSLRFEPLGQDAMKGAAREKTALGPRGASKPWGTASCLLKTRMELW